MNSTNRGLIAALVFLLVVAVAFSSLRGGMVMMRPWMMGRGVISGGGWGWTLRLWLGGLAILAFWGGLIVGALLLVRILGGASARGFQDSPLDVLKRRYAAGEINREQFEQMRQDLER